MDVSGMKYSLFMQFVGDSMLLMMQNEMQTFWPTKLQRKMKISFWEKMGCFCVFFFLAVCLCVCLFVSFILFSRNRKTFQNLIESIQQKHVIFSPYFSMLGKKNILILFCPSFQLILIIFCQQQRKNTFLSGFKTFT